MDLPYREVNDMPKLRAVLDEKLEDYNAEPKLLSMNLVLFDDACRHICRIVRVLKLSRGNMMLVGVGGSGRQSLARLSSFICEYNVFTIKITNNYRVVEFHEDLKTLYRLAGMEGKPTTFLFNDTQVKDETFLEDINNILSSGEVPNLFKRTSFPRYLMVSGNQRKLPASRKCRIYCGSFLLNACGAIYTSSLL